MNLDLSLNFDLDLDCQSIYDKIATKYEAPPAKNIGQIKQELFRLLQKQDPLNNYKIFLVDNKSGQHSLKNKALSVVKTRLVAHNEPAANLDQIIQHGIFDQLMTLYLNYIQNLISKMGDAQNKQILLSENSLTSGCIAFYGSAIVSFLATGQIHNLDNLFHFTTLYMLTDHTLDSVNESESSKLDLALKLYRLLENPVLLSKTKNDKQLGLLCQSLLDLMRQVPSSYPAIKLSYQAEMISFMLQNRADLDIDLYLKMSQWKGATMVQAMQAIVGLTPDDQGYLLGTIIQFADDIDDVSEDMADGINTIATHMVKHYKYLDNLLYYTIMLVESVAGQYKSIRPLILLMLMHSVSKVPYFSKELVAELKPYFPLQPSIKLQQNMHHIMIQKLNKNK